MPGVKDDAARQRKQKDRESRGADETTLGKRRERERMEKEVRVILFFTH